MLRHAMIPATTEACIIASAGLDTLSPEPVPCLLSLVPETRVRAVLTIDPC